MVTMFFIMPLLGVQQGVAPVMGYNWGARNYRRVREALFLGLWTSTAVVSLAAAVEVFAAVPIVRLFADGSDAAFIRLAAGDLRVSNCMLWCIGLNHATGLCAPATAIWLSMPISDVLACLATVPPFLSHARFLARAGRARRSAPVDRDNVNVVI